MLLREALSTDSSTAAIRAAERFLAVREARHRDLGPALTGFETATELKEGLAEYAFVRAVGGAVPPASQPPPAPLLRTAPLRRLRDLTAQPDRSIRLRFYSTGSAFALLFDRLEGEGWKVRLEREDLTLQDTLADAIRYRDRERRVRRAAMDARPTSSQRVARRERLPLRLSPAREDEANHLVALALRSKATWGYDSAFMECCTIVLAVEAGYVRDRSISASLSGTLSAGGDPCHSFAGIANAAAAADGLTRRSHCMRLCSDRRSARRPLFRCPRHPRGVLRGEFAKPAVRGRAPLDEPAQGE